MGCRASLGRRKSLLSPPDQFPGPQLEGPDMQRCKGGSQSSFRGEQGAPATCFSKPRRFSPAGTLLSAGRPCQQIMNYI
ncbi:hypothetical protein Y1Q_0005422 [Alligator mississippiensis]|uniref:Uncharacterized protein n=1 Tax=Alligator mississippiensis TaxID=8496 RepID=A0A151MZK8_ALLMI|nr:hypothetical protein Y1Q_0005422 [Alligator mississippiensis]